MEFWLTFNNGAEGHQLPVAPSAFEIKDASLNTIVNISSLGNINLIGNRDVKKVTLESFFPAQDYPFVTTTKRHNPFIYIQNIKKWKESKKPIRLTITGTPINIALAIDNFDYGVRDGTKDIYYTLEMSEYRFTGVTANGGAQREVKETPSTYTVKSGDTLSVIAKKLTGDSANYKSIAEKNGIKNPNAIEVGQVLKI